MFSLDLPLTDIRNPLHAFHMEMVLEEAAAAGAAGEVPVGCIIVSFERGIIARAYNQRELLQDPTAHAEMLAITQAAQALGSWRLEECASLRNSRTLCDVRRGHRAGTAASGGLRLHRSQGGRLRYPLPHPHRSTAQPSSTCPRRRPGRPLRRHPDRLLRRPTPRREEVNDGGLLVGRCRFLGFRTRNDPGGQRRERFLWA